MNCYPYSISDVFSYLALTFNITGPGGLFNNAYWSLPVEFQYYIIFPIILASLKYIGALGPIILGVMLYFLPKFGFIDFDRNTVFTLAFSFCGGVLVGYIYKISSFRMNSLLGFFLFIVTIFMASAIKNSYIMLPDISLLSRKWNWYGVIAIVTVFVVLVTKVSFHNKVEEFLKHYGTISYSTYLYHNIFVAIAVLFVIRFEIHDSSLRLFITFFFTLIASYLVATISYKYIEKPSISIGRNFVGKNITNS